ncbi:hypothetical protein XA68_14043 [Ophiocordyceps unilateralis]|uniref:2EXR domain-containing protein n=1 Tax=Ophiocordyceps unilateralis TaxID=268505 RepID=A0A2A9PBI8_OPHUN|nr:hypothetical protein XA68_14043 [Ophiocordyceps unilateralis]
MTDQFSRFPQLPAEVRLEIWRLALADWNVTGCAADGVKALRRVGRFNSSIGQSCYEAWVMMKKTHTHIPRIGWINFSRHIFLLNGAEKNEAMMRIFDHYYDVLSRMQHLALSPRSFFALNNTLRDVVRAKCSSLRNLIIFAPWMHTAQLAKIDFCPYFRGWAHLDSSTVPVQNMILSFAKAQENADYNRLYQMELEIVSGHELAVTIPAHDSRLDGGSLCTLLFSTRRNDETIAQEAEDIMLFSLQSNYAKRAVT